MVLESLYDSGIAYIKQTPTKHDIVNELAPYSTHRAPDIEMLANEPQVRFVFFFKVLGFGIWGGG